MTVEDRLAEMYKMLADIKLELQHIRYDIGILRGGAPVKVYGRDGQWHTTEVAPNGGSVQRRWGHD